jgi:L-lactate dehydrogenase complex protein LldE
MIVDIFIPCFIDQFFPATAMNMVRVLEKTGCGVNYDVEQTCCGQHAFRDGYWDNCKAVGEKLILEMQNDRYIVCPGAACTGMVKNYYPEMFHNTVLHNEYKQVQKNFYEFSDFLVNILHVTDVGAKLKAKATYLDSCSALRECKIREAPRTLLNKVKGLQLVEMEDAETCCGFGGKFSVQFEEISLSMASRKVEHALKTGAEYIISTDLDCLTHLEIYIRKNNLQIKTMHIADLLVTGC